MSLDWIESLQEDQTSSGRTIFKWVTDILGPTPIFVIVGVFFFNYGSIIDAYFVIIGFSFSGYLMGVTKVIYHDPRPFMSRDAIESPTCTRGYGNPSGHSQSIAMVTFTVVLLYHGYSA